MTCSCTSALSNVPASERCVKARRSPTKSWQIAALANLRPTIYAPPDKRFPPASAGKSRSKYRKAALVRGLFYSVDASDLAIDDERRHYAITEPTW
jgi:hypothetical protein